MKKFIESKRNELVATSTQQAHTSENILRQIHEFTQSLIAEVSAKSGQESIEHAIKGLLAIDDFAKKNAINRTTIMPPPMAKSLEPVCSCMVGIPTACAVCVTAVVACWVASLACGMTKP